MPTMYKVEHGDVKIEPMNELAIGLNGLIDTANRHPEFLIKEVLEEKSGEFDIRLVSEQKRFKNIKDIPKELNDDIFNILVVYKFLDSGAPKTKKHQELKFSLDKYEKWVSSNNIEIIDETFVHANSISTFKLLELPQEVKNTLANKQKMTKKGLSEMGVSWNEDSLNYEVSKGLGNSNNLKVKETSISSDFRKKD